MNFKSLLLLSLLALMAWTSPSRAQDAADATAADAPPPGSTVITSDELRSDQASHVSVFSGSVMVVGTNFTLTCKEMTVNFTKDNKVDVITATGDVVITQPGRVTHSGQAQYFREDDKFVLTDQPNILDNKNQIFAPIITIYRTKQTMLTSGGKSRVVLSNGTIGTSTSTTTPATSSP